MEPEGKCNVGERIQLSCPWGLAEDGLAGTPFAMHTAGSRLLTGSLPVRVAGANSPALAGDLVRQPSGLSECWAGRAFSVI